MADAAEKTAVQEAAESAGVGGLLVSRWLGCWIDILAVVGLFFLPTLALRPVVPLDEQAGGYVIIASLVVCVLYFPLTEGLSGRTLGKVIAGLKVVDKNGRVPGFGRALVRTLLRLVEVNPVLLGGIPAGIVVLCTKRKQRLGDLVAGTYVLRADSLRQMADVDATLAAMRSGSTA